MQRYQIFESHSSLNAAILIIMVTKWNLLLLPLCHIQYSSNNYKLTQIYVIPDWKCVSSHPYVYFYRGTQWTNMCQKMFSLDEWTSGKPCGVDNVCEKDSVKIILCSKTVSSFYTLSDHEGRVSSLRPGWTQRRQRQRRRLGNGMNIFPREEWKVSLATPSSSEEPYIYLFASRTW